jgi:glycine cleavage system H protein
MAGAEGSKTLVYPPEYKYVKTHEYVRLESNNEVTIGVTAFAADQLGDVTYVELPKVGQRFKKEGKFGVIESVKSVSDLFMPVGGEITAVNERLNSEPELVNLDCYGEGWMIKVLLDQPAELDAAWSADQYMEFVAE